MSARGSNRQLATGNRQPTCAILKFRVPFFAMPFQIKPIREFLVRPSLPPALSRMAELAYNVVWSWEPVIRSLFRRLDPVLWRESGYNPVVLLGRVPQVALDRAAADPRYTALYTQACERYDAQIKSREPDPGGP